jgi:hypothetical protein
MAKAKYDESIVVFTYQDTGTLIDFGGSQSWALNRTRVGKCKYIICARNCNHSLSDSSTGHGEAFLVGKVSGVRPAFTNQFANRFLIEFDEYVEVSIPGFWSGSQNPVRFFSTSDLKIEFEKLNFIKMPKRNYQAIDEHIAVEDRFSSAKITDELEPKDQSNRLDDGAGISIKEAKRLLAMRHDVDEENIEILIKG